MLGAVTIDLNAWGQVAGLCAIVGGAAFFLGGKIAGWNIEKLETKIEGLQQQLINAERARKTDVENLKQKLDNAQSAHKTDVEGFKHRIANAEGLNKFNEKRWEDAQRKADETEKELSVVRAKLDQLENQQATGATQAEIDRTAIEVRSSLTKALVANTGTSAILSSGPVQLFISHHGSRSPPATEQLLWRAVSWDDVGKPTEPGTYNFSDGKISIGPEEIQFWRENPHARLHASATASWEFPESGERPLFKPGGGWDFPRK